MPIKKICLTILLAFCSKLSAQSIIDIDFQEYVLNKQTNLNELSDIDTNKLVVIIFTKASNSAENIWLENLDYLHNLDTNNIIFYKLQFPVICAPTLDKEIKVGNKIIYSLQGELGHIPDGNSQFLFKVLIIANDNSKRWATKKIGTEGIFKTTNATKIKNKKNSEQQRKKNLLDVYVFDSLKFRDEFILLVTKSPTYSNLTKLEANVRDSFIQMRKEYKLFDSLSKLTSTKFLSFEINSLLINSNKHSSKTTHFYSTQTKVKILNALSRNLPLFYSFGVGIQNLNLITDFDSKVIDLGYHFDQYGDQFKSELLNFHSTEMFEIKNYSFSLGLTLFKPIENMRKKSDPLNNNNPQKKAWNYSTYYGIQLDLNSKPQIQQSTIKTSDNIQESRQYQVLNFDRTTQPTTVIIKFPDNFRSYYACSVTVGLKAQKNHFLIFPSFFYYKSSILFNEGHATFQKQQDQIVYAPLTLTQQKINIQSFGLNISIGYEIY